MLIAVQAFRRLRQYTLIRISRRVRCSNFKFLTNTHHSVPWWMVFVREGQHVSSQATKCPAVWTFIEGHVAEFFASPVIRPIRGPKWPKERSPGFTLGCSPHPNSPEAHKAHECAFHESHPVLRVGDAEGAVRYGDIRLGTFEPDRVPGKGRWDSARFHPRTPTQAGSLCYIALRSLERFAEMLPEGSSARPPLPRDGVSVA
jgi:hypothetical protein